MYLPKTQELTFAYHLVYISSFYETQILEDLGQKSER